MHSKYSLTRRSWVEMELGRCTDDNSSRTGERNRKMNFILFLLNDHIFIGLWIRGGHLLHYWPSLLHCMNLGLPAIHSHARCHMPGLDLARCPWNRIESSRGGRSVVIVRLLAHVDSTTVYMYIWSVAMGIIFKTGMSIWHARGRSQPKWLWLCRRRGKKQVAFQGFLA